MVKEADPITFSVPRTVLTEIIELTADLNDRMHELLERNTNGQLGPTEKTELEMLVRIAAIGQIVSTALQPTSQP
jgi:hypothetical protein